jgi:hypothetical protein
MLPYLWVPGDVTGRMAAEVCWLAYYFAFTTMLS